MDKPEISIILPVFNEAGTVEAVLDKLSALPFSKEIVIVNDGSSDGTTEILRNFDSNSRFKIVEHKNNVGKGAAIRSGIKIAKGDFIIIQDADLEQNPHDIVNMLKFLKENDLDAVFGTRILNWGLQFDIRFVANMFFALLTNILFRYHLTDIMTGYKLCKRRIINNLNLNANGFDIEPEITAKLLKRKVRLCEIPIYYRPRTRAEGKKIRFCDSFKIVCRLLLERVIR